MKKLAWILVLGFIALGNVSLVMAQAPTTCPTGTTAYTPVDNDSPWRLEGPKWERLIASNLWLNDRITRRTADDIHVLIRLTDVLCLPEGVTAADFKADPAKTTATSSIKAAVVEVKSGGEKEIVAASGFPVWFGWLLLVLAVLATVAVIAYFVRGFLAKRQRRLEREERERQLAMDPITSGAPYVPGGIQPTETVRLEEFFERQATDAYAQAHPAMDRATIRVERISPIVRGMLSNEGMVRYRGQDAQPRRFDPPVPGYQARFRNPDGTEEVLQSLQGCMNPVVFGGEVLVGFTFTPIEEVVPMPTPAPTPTDIPTGPRAILATAARVPAEQVLFTIGGMRMMVPTGSIVRAGENGEINLTVAGPCDIRIQQSVKAKRPKVVKSTTTATA